MIAKGPRQKAREETQTVAQSLDLSGVVSAYLIEHPPSAYTHPSTHPATIITGDTTHRFVTDAEKTTWGHKVDQASGYSLVADTEIAKIHSAGSDNQDLSGLVSKESGKSLVSDTEIAKIHEHGNATVLNGTQESYTTAEKTKLAGLSNYVAPGFNSVYRTILDSTGSHIAAKAAGTYGIPQGNPLAVSGTGTLYALNVIYIDSNDYPTIDGKAAKLRVRCVIECNDVAPFTGTMVVGLHPVTRPATSGAAGLCIHTIGTAVSGSTVTLTNPAADSQNNLAGADFALPANGFYILAMVTNATMATSSHCHISASLQIRNA
jgi:hypothetical protein